MKYHISVKFIAIVLATVFLAVSVGSAVGIITLVESGLYERTVEDVYENSLTSKCHGLAVELAHRYASLELGDIPESYLESYRDRYWTDEFLTGHYFYTIRDYQVSISGSLDLPLCLHRDYRVTKGGGDTLDKILCNIALLEQIPRLFAHACRVHAQQHFARAGLRDLPFNDLQNLRATVFVYNNCFHCLTPSALFRRFFLSV